MKIVFMHELRKIFKEVAENQDFNKRFLIPFVDQLAMEAIQYKVQGISYFNNRKVLVTQCSMLLDNHLLEKVVLDMVAKEAPTKVSKSDTLDLPDFTAMMKGYSLLTQKHPIL